MVINSYLRYYGKVKLASIEEIEQKLNEKNSKFKLGIIFEKRLPIIEEKNEFCLYAPYGHNYCKIGISKINHTNIIHIYRNFEHDTTLNTFKSNIWLLKKLNPNFVITLYNCKIVNTQNYKIGDIIIARDIFAPWIFINYEKKDINGFFEILEPYDNRIINYLLRISQSLNIEIKDGGIVSTFPREEFITRSELKFASLVGVNLINDINAFEAFLLCKANIKQVALCLAIDNFNVNGYKNKNDEKNEIIEKVNLIINKVAELLPQLEES